MMDKPELGIADLSRAIELGESTFDYLNRAQTYERLGKNELAIKDYSRMLELEPDHIYIYNSELACMQKLAGTTSPLKITAKPSNWNRIANPHLWTAVNILPKPASTTRPLKTLVLLSK